MNKKRKKIAIVSIACVSCLLLLGGVVTTTTILNNRHVDNFEDNSLIIKSNNVKAKKISDNEYQLTATVYPEYNFNKAVTWSLKFSNESSSWAVDKNVKDYVEIVVDEKDQTIANIKLKQAFGEQITVMCASTNYPDIYASCTIDYEKKVEGVSFYINDDKSLTNPYISEGDSIKTDYKVEYSPVFSLDKEYSDLRLTVDVYLKDHEPGEYKILYDSSGKKIDYTTVINYLKSLINNGTKFSTTILMDKIKNNPDADISLGNENIEEKELYVKALKEQQFTFRGQLYEGDNKLKEDVKSYTLKLKDVTSLSLSESIIIF